MSMLRRTGMRLQKMSRLSAALRRCIALNVLSFPTVFHSFSSNMLQISDDLSLEAGCDAPRAV